MADEFDAKARNRPPAFQIDYAPTLGVLGVWDYSFLTGGEKGLYLPPGIVARDFEFPGMKAPSKGKRRQLGWDMNQAAWVVWKNVWNEIVMGPKRRGTQEAATEAARKELNRYRMYEFRYTEKVKLYPTLPGDVGGDTRVGIEKIPGARDRTHGDLLAPNASGAAHDRTGDPWNRKPDDPIEDLPEDPAPPAEK